MVFSLKSLGEFGAIGYTLAGAFEQSPWDQIQSAIGQAEHLIVIVTLKALESEYIRKEWREARRQGVMIVPVLGDETLRGKKLPRWVNAEEVFRLNKPERLARFIATLKARPQRLKAVWDDGGYNLENVVPRTGKQNQIRQALLDETGSAFSLTSAIQGRGGYGKTLLASAMCQDIEIQNAFIDGIFWVTAGRDTFDKVSALAELVERISGQRATASDEGSLANELARCLEGRAVLIVVDDVWTNAQIDPFKKATKNAALLFTTRNPDLADESAQSFEIDALTPDEVNALICRGIPKLSEAESAELCNFAKRLWGWPQLISICNSAIRRRTKRGMPIQTAITRITDHLPDMFVDAPDERGRTLVMAMEESLATLSQSKHHE